MSAMTGICDFFAMAGSASASSDVGTATRTMSQPAVVSSAICCSVALMSVVGVVVIDWMLIGASPPTATLPTWILRDLRRGASVGAGGDGMPRLIAVTAPVSRFLGLVTHTGRPRTRPSTVRCHSRRTSFTRDARRPGGAASG